MTDATDETPKAQPVEEGSEVKALSIHDGSSGDIGLFGDLSQKSEKLLRYPNSPIADADIGTAAEVFAQTPENEGNLADSHPPQPASAPELAVPASLPPAEPFSVPGEAIALVEPVRARTQTPSASGPLLIFFLASFSVCSAGLNVYLFWQARNLGAELEKRPPAPKPPAWQKR